MRRSNGREKRKVRGGRRGGHREEEREKEKKERKRLCGYLQVAILFMQPQTGNSELR